MKLKELHSLMQVRAWGPRSAVSLRRSALHTA